MIVRYRPWLTLLAAALGSASAHASIGGARSVRVELGPPPAQHAMPGVNARRSRLSPVRLSGTPRVASRLRVAYGIGRGLAVRDDSSLVIAHPNARCSSFDAGGKMLYSHKLPAEPAFAPVITASAGAALISRGTLWVLDTDGSVRFRSELGSDELDVHAVLAAQDGSVLVSAQRSLYKVSAFGKLEWHVPTGEALKELLEADRQWLASSESGKVFNIEAGGRLRRLGDLGAPLGSVSLSEDGKLLAARSGQHRIATLVPASGVARIVSDDPALLLDGPLMFALDHGLLGFTSDGLLVRWSKDGSEAQRVPVDPSARRAPAPELVLQLLDGRVLVARAGADTLVVTPGGEVTAVGGSGCPDPIGLYAFAKNSLLLACRSGNLLTIE
jgi:hypothetical protein